MRIELTRAILSARLSDFLIRGRVYDFFIFWLFKFILFFVNWISLYFFPFVIKYYHIMFIIIVFWWGCDRPSGLLLLVSALLLSILTPSFLPSSSDSLSYFVLAVPMRECLRKHSCMSSPCLIAILNGTFLFLRGEIVCLGRNFVYQNQIKLTNSDFLRNSTIHVHMIWY